MLGMVAMYNVRCAAGDWSWEMGDRIGGSELLISVNMPGCEGAEMSGHQNGGENDSF